MDNRQAAQTIVQLNNYPRDKYNVLIPVTSMQVMSNLQKVIVNEVRLDADPKGGNDVYLDKQTGKLAITAIGGTKLAAAANISFRYSFRKCSFILILYLPSHSVKSSLYAFQFCSR